MAKSIFEQLGGTYERQGEFSAAFSFREFF